MTSVAPPQDDMGTSVVLDPNSQLDEFSVWAIAYQNSKTNAVFKKWR
jgi:hypothetical protein